MGQNKWMEEFRRQAKPAEPHPGHMPASSPRFSGDGAPDDSAPRNGFSPDESLPQGMKSGKWAEEFRRRAESSGPASDPANRHDVANAGTGTPEGNKGSGKWAEEFRRRAEPSEPASDSANRVGAGNDQGPKSGGARTRAVPPEEGPPPEERRRRKEIDFACGVCGPVSPPDEHLRNLKRMRYALDTTWTSMMLANNLQIRSVLICGATYGEGATFVSFHTSLFLALEQKMKVLYIDTAIGNRSPVFNSGDQGLVSYVEEEKPLTTLVKKTGFEGLYVLPAGSGRYSSGSSRFVWNRDVLRKLKTFCSDYFDVAVYDGQPVTGSPSMIEFGRMVDQVLLVCRYGVSRREVSQIARENLANGGVTLSGVILNCREYPIPARLYKMIG